ncbi:alternative oxidase [Candidatus Paracaedibacter symbiosus]|uniref:alternative oxidase n=1 Tax=Candidatus Paracaedibacter symbiosus TaxID=244582 RepID=UPI0005097BB1|nr:alternative oxidase [Candidatus Paracaedibacter symbiosus]
MTDNTEINLNIHHQPTCLRDHIAFSLVKFMRFFADTFFRKRYGHRAVILETVAAVPGMVGGMLKHLKCLRRIEDDEGWIRELLDEAENERMHLMTFIKIAQPNFLERCLIIFAQIAIFTCYLTLYIFTPKTAHRVVGYLEEEAVISYTHYLNEVERGATPNVDAPAIAKEYWNLSEDAKLADLIRVVRADECKHRDVNHRFANQL